MQLADFLATIGTTYDRKAPMNSRAQLLLREASSELLTYCPPAIVAEGSGGKGRATFTPWIRFFDPDEAPTAQAGLYVVYLFAADLQTVTLSLNQGIESLSREIGERGARASLRSRPMRSTTFYKAISVIVLIARSNYKQKVFDKLRTRPATY